MVRTVGLQLVTHADFVRVRRRRIKGLWSVHSGTLPRVLSLEVWRLCETAGWLIAAPREAPLSTRIAYLELVGRQLQVPARTIGVPTDYLYGRGLWRPLNANASAHAAVEHGEHQEGWLVREHGMGDSGVEVHQATGQELLGATVGGDP